MKWFHIIYGHLYGNIKLFYYIAALWRTFMPECWCRYKRKQLMDDYAKYPESIKELIKDRVDYYCQLPENALLPVEKSRAIGDHTLRNKEVHSVYFFDTKRYTRCFNGSLRWHHEAGDVYYAADVPSIAKSRPIGAVNNVLINQDRVRHFIFVKDPFKWGEKKSIVLFRGACHCKPRREKLLEMYADNPRCNIRDFCPDSTNKPEWRDFKGMSLYEHLKYRYILSLEGNDVASNLKWLMSSNSIAVMPKPTVESWFMEGRLIPDYHYICIADDYHDLIERIDYYESHQEEALEIVRHANDWCKQFCNDKTEDIVSLLTFEEYFKRTGQKL